MDSTNNTETLLHAASATEPDRPPRRRSARRQTAHLKQVPPTRALREALRATCQKWSQAMDRSAPPTHDDLEILSRRLLREQGQPEAFLGWTMVILSSCFWEEQVQAIPYSRRLFLLPHCLKHAEGCPADYDEFGLDCKTCGACSIAGFRSAAQELGYKVLVAEGSPIVLKIIVSGHVDAIVGVACLNVLEKAIDKIMMAGIPCMAVPLLSSDCRNTSVDEDWVETMVRVPFRPASATDSAPPTYVHLMRAAEQMFQPASLQRLAPTARGNRSLAESNGRGTGEPDPIAATETIARDFLAVGGKRSRPFITLAVYDAMRGGKGCLLDGRQAIDQFPDSVLRTALSIEAFHKASLVHDDIQDGDEFRYGRPSLHVQHGTATAINIGDYLIGWGYRLISQNRKALGAETASDLLDFLADAHQRLCEGQGAELIWRDRKDKRLKPIDALKIYALKTAPPFEAALSCGMRLAGSMEDALPILRRFALNLGVAFQILNDLKDWKHDSDNKKTVGADLLGNRPTLLWALALDALDVPRQDELIGLVRTDSPLTDEQKIGRAHALYCDAGVFEKSNRLIEKHRTKAIEVADEIESDALRRLLHYLIETVLDRSEDVKPTIPIVSLACQTDDATHER